MYLAAAARHILQGIFPNWFAVECLDKPGRRVTNTIKRHDAKCSMLSRPRRSSHRELKTADVHFDARGQILIERLMTVRKRFLKSQI